MKPKIYFADDDDLVDICKDNVFKAVFTRNTPEYVPSVRLPIGRI